MQEVISGGGSRTHGLRASGANGGNAAPVNDGMIRWWCPTMEDLGDDGDHSLPEQRDERTLGWERHVATTIDPETLN